MSKRSAARSRNARLLLGLLCPLASVAVFAQPAFAQANDRAAPAPSANIKPEPPGPLLDSPAKRPESATIRAVNAAIRLGRFRHATALLETAANSGDSEAQYLLSSLYRSGQGVRQDDALAFKWDESRRRARAYESAV